MSSSKSGQPPPLHEAGAKSNWELEGAKGYKVNSNGDIPRQHGTGGRKHSSLSDRGQLCYPELLSDQKGLRGSCRSSPCFCLPS